VLAAGYIVNGIGLAVALAADLFIGGRVDNIMTLDVGAAPLAELPGIGTVVVLRRPTVSGIVLLELVGAQAVAECELISHFGRSFL
jgi:hypothetical protein